MVVKDSDRQSGMYILGVQGVGKSSLLETMIYQDIFKGQAVFVLDPHGDLIEHVITQMPSKRVKDTYVLDIEDVEYPFGVNLFNVPAATATQQAQALDRILHVFEKCFPDTSRMLLEKYLGNIAPVFLANASGGYSMADIPKFLRDEAFRERLVKNKRVGYFIREFWQEQYNSLSPSKRQMETASLATRLNRFVRSPISGNIIGQSTTTIDFRRAIENKEILLIKLPIKTLKEDASLIGTMLIAQIHAAIFSFADTLLEDRPGFSLFVDEFQHFATSDFAEMFTEGRKFGSRVCVAHQFRSQIPDYLASATLTARSIVTFQTTQEDASKMAPLYVAIDNDRKIQKEDIHSDVIKKLLTYGHENPTIEKFIKQYLRPVHMQLKGNRVEITSWQPSMWKSHMEGGRAVEKVRPRVLNPLQLLNPLLYEIQIKKNWQKPIPYDVIWGFSDCGVGFYHVFENTYADEKAYLASWEVVSGTTEKGERIKKHLLETQSGQQLLDFLITLRSVMQILVQEPLGEKKATSTSEIAQRIVNLPRRQALVKVGTDIAPMRTIDAPSSITSENIKQRKQFVLKQTRARYCKGRDVVEQEIENRQQQVSEPDNLQAQ
jgi:hypothetical protein